MSHDNNRKSGIEIESTEDHKMVPVEYSGIVGVDRQGNRPADSRAMEGWHCHIDVLRRRSTRMDVDQFSPRNGSGTIREYSRSLRDWNREPLQSYSGRVGAR